MKKLNAGIAVALGLAIASFGTTASAQQPFKIGVLNDLSGPYSDYQGQGSIIAARMAVEDYGSKAAGRPIEVVFADHQNKPDIGATIGRKWYDTDGVEMIVDVPNSAIAFGISDIAKDKNKVFIGSGAGSAELTGSKCSPNTVHWTYDTYSYGRGIAKAVIGRGGKKWFFITADYAFGHDLEKQAATAVTESGGTVVGIVRHPINTSDFSSYLLQAQSSGADILALANAGDDTTNAMKQANEFGLKQKQVGIILGMNGIPGLGLEAAKGSVILNPFYWDLNDGTRAFSSALPRSTLRTTCRTICRPVFMPQSCIT